VLWLEPAWLHFDEDICSLLQPMAIAASIAGFSDFSFFLLIAETWSAFLFSMVGIDTLI